MTRDEKRPRRDGAPKRPKPARRDRGPQDLGHKDRGTTDRASKDQTAAPKAEAADAARPQPRQRIAKLMARAGLCSRRDAEAWILEGRVVVNGTVLKSPAIDVGPEDEILVDDAALPLVEKTRLFLFHKPRGLVTSDHDPEGRATVADFLRENWPDGPRTVTIGRLDINTEGLLLLTNDGGLARVLELPQTGWVRRYRVRAKGETDQGKLDALARGISIDGVDYIGIEAKLDRIQGSNCWLTMGLREGKNREIKRVLEQLGLEVNRLIRLSFGPFQLLDLPEGAVEEVRNRVLRDQLGEALAAEAGVDLGDAPAPARIERPRTDDRTKPADRAQRGERPTRDTRPRTGERPHRDESRGRGEGSRGRDDATDAPPPIRERPQAGTRKHVSTLRAAAKDAALGPRKRIERSETADRKSRTIRVERLVSAKPVAEAPRKRRTPEGGERAGPRDGFRGDTPARGHASPSALGKRERMARSGARDDRAKGPRDEARRGEAREPRRDSSRPVERRPERDRSERPGGGDHRQRRPDHRERPAPGRSDDRREQPDRASRPKPSGGPKRLDARSGERFGAPRTGDRPGGGPRPSRSGDSRERSGAGGKGEGGRPGGSRDGGPKPAFKSGPRTGPKPGPNSGPKGPRGGTRGPSAPKR